MIVVLDGPAGAGKSTVARRLAKRLGVDFLDTGAFYRTATLAAMRRGVVMTDLAAILRVIDACRIELHASGKMTLDGEDVSDAIRTPEVTRAIFHVADSGPARERVNVLLRGQVEASVGFVAEGRDLGTVVFPSADVKIYLDASSEVRAARRLADLAGGGISPLPDLETVKREIEERDRKDMTRAVAPLKRADDAIYLDTSALDRDQVVAALEKIVRDARAERA